MLNLSPKRKNYQVKVTDRDGNIEIFNSVRDTAVALDVAVHTVYQAVCNSRKVRGCVIEKNI